MTDAQATKGVRVALDASSRDVDDAIRFLQQLKRVSAGSDHEVIPDREPLVAWAGEVFDMRMSRTKVMPASLLGEPAWDMLLALYSGRTGPRPSVTSLAYITLTPVATAIRWIDVLQLHGVVVRSPCRFDGRVVLVELTDEGRAIMDRIFSQMLRSRL